MSNTIQGKLIQVFDKQTFDSGFEKRDIVVETLSEYPQQIKCEIHKDKADKISQQDVDRHITVYYDLRGREWNDKYFVNVVAWKWEFNSAGINGSGEIAKPDTSPDEDEKELPF